MKVFDVGETRLLEQEAVEQGMEHLQLMENAGGAAVRFLMKKYSLSGKTVAIFCGKGNNGGDGFVAARLLSEQGAAVVVVLVQGLPATEDAKAMLARLRGYPVKIHNTGVLTEPVTILLATADFILDAIYGTGFRGTLPEELSPLIDAVNRSPATVVALDIPSGACCNNGEVEGNCVRAQYTIAFTVRKPGHLIAPAQLYCGQVIAVPIGISSERIERQETKLQTIEESQVRRALPVRDPQGNKGTFGRVVCLCGSEGMSGAAFLSAAAAARCGAGLVEAVLPRSIYPIVAARLPEAVYTLREETDLRAPLKRASACLLGCGLGQEPHTEELFLSVFESLEVPFVCDADGINFLAKHKDVWKRRKAPAVLTPHPGEMARLMETTVKDIQEHRLRYARKFAQDRQVVLVLKGANTLIAVPDGRVWINTTGNSGLAKGGSGDVLAGMTASFLAQGLQPEAAAVAAVWLHGTAGDRCAKRLSQTAMLPTDLLEELPFLFLKWNQ